ncbi:MAG: ASCH domain-containing protein [Betaproteobacteria bacterium]
MTTDTNESGVEPWKLPSLEEVLATLRCRGIVLEPGANRVGAFGDSADLSNELLALIRSGNKRGGACLLWTLEALNQALPAAGDIEIVLDHLNQPALVTRTVRVEAKPFHEVGADFAAVEGEGDGSLEYWQREHWKYFSRECVRLGRVPDHAMIVICETFEMLQILAL